MRGMLAIVTGVVLASACSNAAPASPGSGDGATGQARANEATGGDTARDHRAVTATIDFSAPDGLSKQIEDLSAALAGARSVDLDLTIIPAEGQPPNYRVRETPQSGAAGPLRCDAGDRLDSRSFAFEFNPDYNHLLLEILHGPAAAVPYATAACSGGGANAPAFVVRGHYAVSAVEIPTAHDIQLRPIPPAPR